jgi:hypothetical protein
MARLTFFNMNSRMAGGGAETLFPILSVCVCVCVCVCVLGEGGIDLKQILMEQG